MPEVEFSENAVPQNVEQVDQLLEQINAPGPDMDAPAPQPETQVADPGKPNPEPEYEIVFRGKKETLPLSKVLSFAQQGRDYADKMREYNQTRHQFDSEKTAWQKERESLQALVNTYKPVDDWVKQNPQVWDRVTQEYRTAQGVQQAEPVIRHYEDRISKLEQFIEQETQSREQERTQKEDQALEAEIQGYRESNPDFDWDSADELGLTLRQKIIQHAVQNHIGTFKAAANDFLWDEHIKRAALKGKEEIGKDIQKKTKLGVVQSPNPSEKLSRVKSVKNLSYDDLTNQALQELGIV